MKYDAFLSVAVQLLPVLWLALAVETVWLSSVARASRGGKKYVATWLASACFGTGGLGEILGLIGILWGNTEVKAWACIWLFVALVLSVALTAFSLMRTVVLTRGEGQGS